MLTPQQFHESAVHHDFFRKHFVIKGIEVAEACANTLHSLERLRGQVAAGMCRRDRVGWAKRKRAHIVASDKMLGGHARNARLCPPYEQKYEWAMAT